jgi:hypothetical protein
MPADIEWDHEVDVLCVGAEGSVLAAGAVAANAGLDVYVGISAGRAADGELAASLGYVGSDKQTTDYLTGFDFAFDGIDHESPRWPVRTVQEMTPPKLQAHPPDVVQPFFGAQLEPWAQQCASAPSGVVYNQVGKRQMAEMRSSRTGETVEAAVVGSIALRPDRPALPLITWLREVATVAGLDPRPGVRLVELIFDEEGLAGATLDTIEGPLTVRARQNLIIGIGDPLAGQMRPIVTGSEPVTAHICLVSKVASRFGQLEMILTNEPSNCLSFLPAPNSQIEHYASGF